MSGLQQDEKVEIAKQEALRNAPYFFNV